MGLPSASSATPGHPPGHIAVHDEAGVVVVVGDAIEYRKKGVRLAGLSFDTLLPAPGHPIIGGAWEELTNYLGADWAGR